jgi:hypothetical protein
MTSIQVTISESRFHYTLKKESQKPLTITKFVLQEEKTYHITSDGGMMSTNNEIQPDPDFGTIQAWVLRLSED